MPEPLLHFSISFAVAAPIIGVKRALVVALISLLPDVDVLLHIHRSATHSILFLSIPIVIAILVLHLSRKPKSLAIASGLGLLSHPLLDSFQSPTPILYPLSNYSYHISPKLEVIVSDKVTFHPAMIVEGQPTIFSSFHSLDAPIFTDVGFFMSLILVSVPLIHAIYSRHRGLEAVTALQGGRKADPLEACVHTVSEELVKRTINPEDVTILIPTLNEEEAIGGVIRELRECGYTRILVIDGYSTDRTVEIARENGAEVVYQVGHGKAAAIRTGLELVKTPYALVMDGDGTYDPRDIERLLRAAVEHECDEVIGYRANRENIPLVNRVGNKLISSLLSLLMGRRIKDPCSGMYLLKMDMVRNLEITATGFDVEAEIVAQVMSFGRVMEVPVNYRRRIGRSKLSSLKAGFRIIWTTIKLGWLYNPIFTFSAIGSILGLVGAIIMIWQLTLRYIHGAPAWSMGWTFLGLTLLVIGLNSFTIATISLLLKRMERRITELYRRTLR